MSFFKKLFCIGLGLGTIISHAMDRPPRYQQTVYKTDLGVTDADLARMFAAYENEQRNNPHFANQLSQVEASYRAQQAPAKNASGVSTEEQEHLDEINLNLEKIKGSLYNIGMQFSGAGISLATVQLQGAAGQAIIGTALSVPECLKIAGYLSDAGKHLDELSKPGVSAEAQRQRDELAPKLNEFNNTINSIKCTVQKPAKSLKAKAKSAYQSIKSKMTGKNPNP